eukprot:s1303_g3.t1
MSCSSSGQLERLGQLRRSFGVWGLQAAAWICGRKLLPRSILLHASPLRLFCRVILAPSAATGWAIACRVAREPQAAGHPGEMAPGKASAKTSATQEKMAKTEICRFNSMGKCKRGAQCSFAHGPEELVSKPDLFKTMLCRKWAKGSCNFTNCTFAHGEEELRDARSKRLTGLHNFEVVAEKEGAILEETCVSEASTEDGGTGTGSASEERMEDHVWGLELLLSAQTAALSATQDAETRPVFVLPGDAAKFPMKVLPSGHAKSGKPEIVQFYPRGEGGA